MVCMVSYLLQQFNKKGEYHLCFSLLNTVITILSPQWLNCMSGSDPIFGLDILWLLVMPVVLVCYVYLYFSASVIWKPTVIQNFGNISTLKFMWWKLKFLSSHIL